jgi:flagellar biosynthesis/type III secretory pathway chaperone
MIDSLINIISKEAALFESFLDLLERQKQALVTNDHATLVSLTARQHESLAEAHRLNSEREQIIASIKRDRSVDGDLTVSRLIAMVDQDQANHLRRLRDSIMSLNDQILETRNSNAMLLNQSREFVNQTMAMLAKLHNPEPVYARTAGQPANPSRPVALDRRA